MPIDAGTADGTTAFCWAAWQGHLAVCRYLAARGADAHSSNSYGCNAALWACQGRAAAAGPGASDEAEPALALCRFLHGELGVDFTLINANGQSCLHKAAQRGRADVCAWLLGAEVGLALDGPHGAPNFGEGSRPAALARFAGHEELAKWLEERQQEEGK